MLSNRSLSWIRLGQSEHALADAKACRALRPDWPKACYREGAALRLMQVQSHSSKRIVTVENLIALFLLDIFFLSFLFLLPFVQYIIFLQKFEEAANAFYEGVMLDPENKELVTAFRLQFTPFPFRYVVCLNFELCISL